MRKPPFSIYENKGADWLHDKPAADERLYFHYTESTIPLPKSWLYSLVCVRPGLKPEDRFSHDLDRIISPFQ